AILLTYQPLKMVLPAAEEWYIGFTSTVARSVPVRSSRATTLKTVLSTFRASGFAEMIALVVESCPVLPPLPPPMPLPIGVTLKSAVPAPPNPPVQTQTAIARAITLMINEMMESFFIGEV